MMNATLPFAIITSTGTKGYHCTEHSSGLSDSLIATLERKALPYGSGWGEYAGARSIKGFPLEKGTMALSFVEVTDQRDDHGRPGILRAHCVVADYKHYASLLREPDFGFAAAMGQDEASAGREATVQAGGGSVASVLRALLGVFCQGKFILRRPYGAPAQWQATERTIRRVLRLLPSPVLKRMSFTTLTLSTAERASLIAVPS